MAKYAILWLNIAPRVTFAMSKSAKPLKFAGTISNMGRHKIVIIPKALHKDAEQYEGKQVIITITDLA